MIPAIQTALVALNNEHIKKHQAYIALVNILASIKDDEQLKENKLVKDFALLSFYLLLEHLYATTSAAKEYLRQTKKITRNSR